MGGECDPAHRTIWNTTNMILSVLLLASATDPYGPLRDKFTGQQCPTPVRGADLYDMSLYEYEQLAKTPPAVVARCIKARQAMLDRKQQSKPARRR
ncbi:MAG: hypothetical protein CVT77_13005 [Alphaproteobacteria bacterium HGW-Alphaproteobacteria-16]|nr:MAG: hypothetical protein CVT77_13005 [Alphaproteobacteria bacterium HGW-Alphaproteobacteria-16]